MTERFSDRKEAGKLLAKALTVYKDLKDAIVLALPRGGAVVGAEIAKALGLPMDLMLVRKLGVPGQEELAMGAIAIGNIQFFNEDVIKHAKVTEHEIENVIAHEKEELIRRNNAYRGGREAPNLKGKTVILVDDGIATGADMIAAVRSAKKLGAGHIIIAVPVSSDSAYEALQNEVDKVISLIVPPFFPGVGYFFDDFRQTDDEEVVELMEQVNQP